MINALKRFFAKPSVAVDVRPQWQKNFDKSAEDRAAAHAKSVTTKAARKAAGK